MNKKKLHILFINSWYPSNVFPNNGDFIQRHAEAAAINYKITSIHVVTDPSIGKNYIYRSNINNVQTLVAYLKPTKNKISKVISFYKAYLKLIRLSGNYDLIQVNRIYPAGIIALVLKLFKGKKYLATEHFTGFLNSKNIKINDTELFISKLICKHAEYICPVSNNLAQSMNNLGLTGNYSIIPNVVDTKTFTPKKHQSEVFTIVHISNLINDHKNISGILRVVKELENYIPDFLFYLIGDNPFQYEDEIKSLEINAKNIQLVDQVPHTEVSKYLQRSNILMLFSNYENLPCVILEAFSCGTKVISTDVGGINEFFPDEFGKLIPSKDEKALHETTLEFYAEKENDIKWKMHNYAVENFSQEIISNHFSILYQNILKN